MWWFSKTYGFYFGTKIDASAIEVAENDIPVAEQMGYEKYCEYKRFNADDQVWRKKKQEECEAIKQSRFKRGFQHTDGKWYPLDLGAQIAYDIMDGMIAKGYVGPLRVITSDNGRTVMTPQEFSAFGIAAFTAGDAIVFKCRDAKDDIENAPTFEEAWAAFVQYRQ